MVGKYHHVVGQRCYKAYRYIGEVLVGKVDSLAHQLVHRHFVVFFKFVFFFQSCFRTVVQHQHHTAQQLRVVVHHGGYVLKLGLVHMGRAAGSLHLVAQHLCKSLYNVQRRAYLVHHVLHKHVLLPQRLLGHLGGVGQLLVVAGYLVGGLAYVGQLVPDALLHGGKAVLQRAHGIYAGTQVDGLGVVVVGSYTLGHVPQPADGCQRAVHTPAAQQHDEHYAQQVEQHHIHHHAVVVLLHVALGTYQRQTPVGARYRCVAHVAVNAVNRQMCRTSLTGGNLVAQGYHLGILCQVLVGEHRLVEQSCRVRMHQIAAVGPQHHKVGIGIWELHAVYGLG